MEHRRIAFVISSLGPGGAERVVTELANNLVSEYEITIIMLVNCSPFYDIDPNVKLLYCSNTGTASTNAIRSLYNGLGRMTTLYKHLRNEQIQLAISFMTTSNIYTIWATKLANIPCIISERANHAIHNLQNRLVKIRNFSYNYCAFLVVQTQENKQFYDKWVASHKIKIIRNPIAEALRLKREIPRVQNGLKYILNVGSFKQGKAQDLLIKAFSAIPNENWDLVFAGEGPTKNKFEALTKKLGSADKIKFIGNKSNIHDYYNKATIFVFTSEHEGFPNALMEALYFGVPCISTNCPHGPSDLITDGENGFLIPVGDQKQLEQKMLLLMNDVKLQAKFSLRAVQSTKRLEMKVISNEWIELINQLP